MTTICWDGLTLAADKQSTHADVRAKVIKLFRIETGIYAGSIAGVAGKLSHALSVIEWIRADAIPALIPNSQLHEDNWVAVMLIKPDKTIWRFEDAQYPFQLYEPYWSIGDGRDFALAAMYNGCTAEQAIITACHFSVNSGMGIDKLMLE